jgi:hypothetical protein
MADVSVMSILRRFQMERRSGANPENRRAMEVENECTERSVGAKDLSGKGGQYASGLLCDISEWFTLRIA